jgi:hypothetical protein
MFTGLKIYCRNWQCKDPLKLRWFVLISLSSCQKVLLLLLPFYPPKLNSEYYWQGSDRIHCVCWFLYVSTILWPMHRDCRIFIVCAWCSGYMCTHTGRGLSSHPKDDVGVCITICSCMLN